MAEFSKFSMWSVGYYRSFSSWVLRHRRTVGARIAVIDAEVNRIGFFTVFYQSKAQDDGSVKVTENPVGFSVTPNSSLERLLRAYIARGGNPLDISGFLMPDRTEILAGEILVPEYPAGGVAAPKSVNYNSPVDDPEDSGFGEYQGGHVPLDGYLPGRLGGRLDRGRWEDSAIINSMHYTRRWANQDIKELQDLGQRIVKLMDLREQLVKEKEETLLQAFGGVITALDGGGDDNRFVRAHLVQNLVQDMYDILFSAAPETAPDTFQTRGDIGFLEFVVKDTTSENRDPLG